MENSKLTEIGYGVIDSVSSVSALDQLAQAIPENNITNWANNNGDLGNSARARVLSCMAQGFHNQANTLKSKIFDSVKTLQDLRNSDNGTEISMGKIESIIEYIQTQEVTLNCMEFLCKESAELYKETSGVAWSAWSPAKIDHTKQTASGKVADEILLKFASKLAK